MKTEVVLIEDLRALAAKALEQRGATAEEANIVVGDYLDAELRGRLSHGFSAFSVALAAFPKGGTAEKVIERSSVQLFDGHGDCGHVVARRAIDGVLESVASSGIVAVGLRDITRFNTPGAIARYGAERGVVTIVLEYGGQNFMIPYGGRTPALSTNPIGIAIPGTDPLFVLDIATSEKAIGYVTLAKAAGNVIPATWAVDAAGEPTEDPQRVAAVKPFGGYKGFGLALAFEILAGALVGVPIGSKGSLARRGALLLLLSPTAFGASRDQFYHEVRDFLAEVKSSPSYRDGAEVRYPGELGEKLYAQTVNVGKISLPSDVLNQIKEAAGV